MDQSVDPVLKGGGEVHGPGVSVLEGIYKQ